jgi:hypothetical protein
MAKNPSRDLLSRVADLGEAGLQRLPSFPGSDKLMDAVNQSRTRLDDMQKRLRGLDVLEKRVDELEQRLAKLEQPAPAKKPTAPRSSTKKPTTPKKPAA